MKILRRLLVGLVVLVLLAIVAVLVAQRFSDGPIGPISGGPLRQGELVTDPNVDWSKVLEPGKTIELELVSTGQSRTTGAFVRDGQLYVPCDLGYLAHKLPSAGMRATLAVISLVKHWNEDAVKDGRVVLRIAGKRYERQAVRVTDPELLSSMRENMEKEAERIFAAQGGLLKAPGDPEKLWIFRMDPRGATPSSGE
ncbi:MAG TPA: hypothetical protein VMR50_07240 [Myxococcota bacterium]|nr:hypothetical protein [Myxococcota bacterium]